MIGIQDEPLMYFFVYINARRDAQGFRGAFRYAEDAAMFVSSIGAGSVVRDTMEEIVWREGSEELNADESFDEAAEIMNKRRS